MLVGAISQTPQTLREDWLGIFVEDEDENASSLTAAPAIRHDEVAMDSNWTSPSLSRSHFASGAAVTTTVTTASPLFAVF